MNERIKELLADATEISDIWVTGAGTSVVDQHIFAELIIMECADVIQDFVDHRFLASEYPSRLKRYFGVK